MNYPLKALSNTYVRIGILVLFLAIHYAIKYVAQPYWLEHCGGQDGLVATLMNGYKGAMYVLLSFLIIRVLFKKFFPYPQRWVAATFAFVTTVVQYVMDMGELSVLLGILLGTVVMVAYIVFVAKDWPIRKDETAA